MKGRWWQRLLRTGGLGSRTLQIQEILEGAEEHLQAAALPGLKTRFLPSRLSIAVAGADMKGLRPFEANLAEDLRGVLARVAQRPGLRASADGLEVELVAAENLVPGSAPRFHAGFPAGQREAAWSPAKPRPGAPTAPAEPQESGPVVEMVLTVLAGERTALQSVLAVSLEPVLAARCLIPQRPFDPPSIPPYEKGGRPRPSQRPADEFLAVDSDHQIRVVATGEPWLKMEPRILELAEPLPAGLLDSVERPNEEAPLALYRFARPGRPDLLWAPRGLVLLGRKPELSHWVPPSAPQNLSGRHLAFLRARGGAVRLVDLGSTNGTYAGGRRLRPFERILLSLPNVVEVGTEGALRIDLRALEDGS